MLTEFFLDHHLFDSNYLRHEDLKIFHQRLIKLWKNYGILIIPCSFDLNKFSQDIKNYVPAKYQQDWIMALGNYKKFRSSEDWESLSNFSDYNELYKLRANFETSFLDENTFICLEDIENFSKISSDDFEILPINLIEDSINFNMSEILSKAEIDLNSNIQDIWDIRFNKLVKYSKNIIIIDQYFFQNTIKDINNNRLTALEFIINNLSGKNKNITIISRTLNNNGRDDKIQFLDNYFNNSILSNMNYNNKISTLKCIAANVAYFSNESHDRYFMFDESHVVRIGKGFDVCRQGNIPRMTLNIVNTEQVDRDRINKSKQQIFLDWKEEYK